MSRPTREQIHQRIDEFLDDVDQRFDREEDAAFRKGAAFDLIVEMAQLAAWLGGRDLLTEAYLGNGEEDDVQELDLLVARILPAAILFGDIDRIEDPYSIRSAIDEIRAVSGEDAPRLFAQRRSVKGVTPNATRLARRELTLLEWAAYFGAQDADPSVWQARIMMAFKCSPDRWRKWKPKVEKYLSKEFVQDRLATAQRAGKDGLKIFRPKASTEEAALIEDGQRYFDEYYQKKGIRKS